MPEIESDLRIETDDGEVYYVRKYFGTPEFYVYDSDGESRGWGKKEDAFMDFLVDFDAASIEPVSHEHAPMGPK